MIMPHMPPHDRVAAGFTALGCFSADGFFMQIYRFDRVARFPDDEGGGIDGADTPSWADRDWVKQAPGDCDA